MYIIIVFWLMVAWLGSDRPRDFLIFHTPFSSFFPYSRLSSYSVLFLCLI